ncbi:MAG TPA: hypothetical protein VFV98_18170 [Vicinamibacterales bacterium]|nr:hypothetical protein [Vicinamibacterales bacterium]
MLKWIDPIFCFLLATLAFYWATGDRVVYYKGGHTPMPRRTGKIVAAFVGIVATALGVISAWLILQGR